MSANAWMMASSVMVSCVMAAVSVSSETRTDVSLCVNVTSQVAVRVFDLRAMEAEVNRIWEPYGVHIDGIRGSCSAFASGPTLTIRLRSILTSRKRSEIPQNVLGSIYFVDGEPQPLIDLWVDEAVRIMGGTSTYFNQGYADGRARVEISRLLARSLAHELGHYLLATEAHTENGLMRRHYGQFDARTNERSGFMLDDDQVVALQRTVSSWTRPAKPETTPVETFTALEIWASDLGAWGSGSMQRR